jgi:hypothetical protein
VSAIGQTLFAVGSGHPQLVTICHQLTSFLAESLFELIPVFASRRWIELLSKHLDNAHHGEPPGIGSLVLNVPNGTSLEECGLAGHTWGSDSV